MIEVKDLSKHFGLTRAVDDISFSIGKGEIVAFLGPNGAGKTTTMRMLTGYLIPTKGRCLINGIDVIEEPIKTKELIGYLPEDNPLYPDMKVYEYLEFVGEIRKIKNLKNRVSEVAEICGVTNVMNKEIRTLSRGYRQRVGVAQAIIHNPDILILDEPTEGLDPNQVIELRNLIKELGKEKTVMLSTHILSEAEATCERVLIINKGKLVADGNKNEIRMMAKGGETIVLEVIAKQNPINELKQISGVKEVTEKKSEDNHYQYELLSEKDVREIIFDTAVSKNWKIIDLHRKATSLEDIFRELTRED
uniref:ATP-binding cassette domain-containing protein n=1 Tax=candidate division WOR-3 bacterium TaxID=2052148 RepID=A0A7C6AEZ1_UNCW3